MAKRAAAKKAAPARGLRDVSRLLREQEARAVFARAVAIRLKNCRTHAEYMAEVSRLLEQGALPVAGLSAKCNALERHAADVERHAAGLEKELARARKSIDSERATLAAVEEDAQARADVAAAAMREVEAANAQLEAELRAASSESEQLGARASSDTAARRAEVAKLRAELAQLKTTRADVELAASTSGELIAWTESALAAAREDVERLLREGAGERLRTERAIAMLNSTSEQLRRERERADAAVAQVAAMQGQQSPAAERQQRAARRGARGGGSELHARFAEQSVTAEGEEYGSLRASTPPSDPRAARTSDGAFVGATPAYDWAAAEGARGAAVNEPSPESVGMRTRAQPRASLSSVERLRADMRVVAQAQTPAPRGGWAARERASADSHGHMLRAQEAARTAEAAEAESGARARAAESEARGAAARLSSAAQEAAALRAELALAAETAARARSQGAAASAEAARAREAAEAAERARGSMQARLERAEAELADSQARASSLMHALAVEVAAKQRALAGAQQSAGELAGAREEEAAASRALDAEGLLRRRLELELASASEALARFDGEAAQLGKRAGAELGETREALEAARAELRAQAEAQAGLAAEVERLGEALRAARQETSARARELDGVAAESREARAVAVEAARRLRASHTHADRALSAEEARHAQAEQRWSSDRARLERALQEARDGMLAERHARMQADALAAHAARQPSPPAARTPRLGGQPRAYGAEPRRISASAW